MHTHTRTDTYIHTDAYLPPNMHVCIKLYAQTYTHVHTDIIITGTAVCLSPHDSGPILKARLLRHAMVVSSSLEARTRSARIVPVNYLHMQENAPTFHQVSTGIEKNVKKSSEMKRIWKYLQAQKRSDLILLAGVDLCAAVRSRSRRTSESEKEWDSDSEWAQT